jgi:hypothetical protein
MKTPVLLAPALLCACAAASPQIDALVTMARAAPAEFSADASIRIAASQQVDKTRKIELLNFAFQRAGSAEHPYKRRAAITLPNSQSGYWNRVYGQDLDTLSLRLRAVSAMLPIDSRKAVDLFLKIPPLRLPRVACEEYLVYDVAPFYELLGDLAHRDRRVLLATYAQSITSPPEIAPMARVISAAGLKDREFERVLAAFGKALGKIGGDDRSFTASSAGKEIESLVEEARRRKLNPLPLIENYRLYLVNNLTAPRCSDDELVQGGRLSFGIFGGQTAEQKSTAEAADFVTFFNTHLRVDPLKPISEQEATPSRLEGVATGLRYCQSAECRAITDQYRRLIIKESGTPYLAAERNSPEWQAKLRDFLASLEKWQPAGEDATTELYQEKCLAYSQLLNVAEGPNREPVFRAFAGFASASPLEKTNRAEWFLPLNGLIGRLSLDPAGFGKFGEELRKSKNPVVALYAALETALPRPAERVLPLM